MTIDSSTFHRSLAGAALLALAPGAAAAQPAPPAGAPTSCRGQGFMAAGIPHKSVEQLPDGRVTFRLCAPDAARAMVISNDLDGVIPLSFTPGGGLPMTRDQTGIWSATTEKPVSPDTYRFSFSVDGARVPDPQGTRFSEERTGVGSTFEAEGPEGAFQAWNKNIPHGAVSTVEYWSTSLGAKRRAHVYTPPGYEKGSANYPVLYLVHGAGDSDDSWTSVGRAHYILDNLIAAGKARPMIIVMPFGHTPDRPGANILQNTDFSDDFFKDLIPYVERTYRVAAGPDSRAMAGLSMGGMHTIRNGLTHPEAFRYIGIFSVGLGVGGDADAAARQVAEYKAQNDAALKRGARVFKLVYFAMGKDDFLYASVKPTREVLDAYGIAHVYNESPGGHTWINWRRYLNDFAPRLFR